MTETPKATLCRRKQIRVVRRSLADALSRRHAEVVELLGVCRLVGVFGDDEPGVVVAFRRPAAERFDVQADLVVVGAHRSVTSGTQSAHARQLPRLSWSGTDDC